MEYKYNGNTMFLISREIYTYSNSTQAGQEMIYVHKTHLPTPTFRIYRIGKCEKVIEKRFYGCGQWKLVKDKDNVFPLAFHSSCTTKWPDSFNGHIWAWGTDTDALLSAEARSSLWRQTAVWLTAGAKSETEPAGLSGISTAGHRAHKTGIA